MESKENFTGIDRRRFIQTGITAAASLMLMGFGKQKIFGLPIHDVQGSIPLVKLNNGVKMPMLGFGTYSLNGEVCQNCVADAISVGYRLFDTATIYGNEEYVGKGIKQSGIKREELFITSKVWVDDSGFEKTKKAFETSLNKLGTDYLDLYLIHRPRGDVKGSWKAMEELYKAGKIKAIGLSNFEPKQLSDIMVEGKVKPTVNQIETHAFFQQKEAYEFLKKSDVQMEAWSPFAEGRNGLFTNETLGAIGKKYNKTVAQVCLRWHFQRGIVAIPRTSKKEHMVENLDIFNFKLSEEDMKTIAGLDLNKTQFPEWS
ncbi:MAG: aldo/keto reductase [Bacteroidales bacterium]